MVEMVTILDNIMTGCSISMHQPAGSERMFTIIDLITECSLHQQGDKEERMKLHDDFFGMHFLWVCPVFYDLTVSVAPSGIFATNLANKE
jgi:hypothetical protein